MCSDAADPDPLIGQSAMANAELSREMMKYFREKDAAQAPRQERMDGLTERLANQQIEASSFNDTQAREMWQRYKETGVPMENAVNAEAMNYDGEAEQRRAAAQASNDVAAQMSAAQSAQQRNLARMGVNPADGRALAMGEEAATTGALAQASAMNKARNDRMQMGTMLRKDAAGLARGMPGTAAQTFGVAAASGGQAQGAVGNAISSANSITGQMGNAFSGAGSLNNSAASIMQQKYNTQTQAAGQGGFGELLGAAGSLGQGLGSMGVFMSDKNEKENRKPVDGDAALAGLKKTDIESWNYKGDSVAADGGQQHIGAMAQDMQKNLGEKVAPGGKMVDLISAVGVTMAAVKAIDKKVDKLATVKRGVKA